MVLTALPKVTTLLDKIPTRLNVAIMMFMTCLVAYMMRVNLSINIIAMVQPPAPNATSTNTTQEPPPNYGPRYNWGSYEQSALLGSYFWGYLFTSLPGGMLAERFGGRDVIGYTLIISAILTALIPIAAGLHYMVVFGLRFLTGFLGGVLYPAQHNLISKWAPPNEKGKFVSALMGGTFGTVITWPFSGLIIETLGWEWAFYVAALITAVITGLWFFIVTNTPATHKRISETERTYIENSLGDSISQAKRWPPFKSVFTSLPFWALIILHYGNMWGLNFLLTVAPKFMSEILNFKVAKAGFLAGLPYLMRMLMAFMFGGISDAMRKRNWLSVTATRKSFCIFSHVIPGIFLIFLAYLTLDPYISVAFITLSLGFNGAATVTNLQNSQDLAPNFAATLYGTINFIGNTPGIIVPVIVAYFTKENNTINEWRYVFWIGASVYIFGAVVFAIFGSGNVQKWNEIKKDDDKENPSNTKL